MFVENISNLLDILQRLCCMTVRWNDLVVPFLFFFLARHFVFYYPVLIPQPPGNSCRPLIGHLDFRYADNPGNLSTRLDVLQISVSRMSATSTPTFASAREDQSRRSLLSFEHFYCLC